MSRTFDLATGPNYSINSVGSCASLGNGAYTIIALFNINAGNNNCGLISFRTAGINAELFVDGNQLFGMGDFAGGQTGITVSTWWWAAIRKAAGSSVYTYSLRQYNTGSASHQSGVATHADSGATNTTIRLGDADDRSNGLIAVLGAWTSRLSDAQVAGMFTTAAADVAAQSPQGLWLGNQASSSDPMNDSAGTANQTSVNGAIGVGADPPGYSYSLGAVGIWIPVASPRRRVQPPRRRPRAATPVRPQVNPPFPFNQVKQPRELRGLRPKRGRASTPTPAQVVIPVVPRQQVRPRLKIVRLFRSRTAAVAPAQVLVAAPAYPLQALRARVRGLRPPRTRGTRPPIDQTAPAGQQRGRLKLPKLFRGRLGQPVPPQIAIVPPAYPPQPVRPRLRGIRIFRGRSASVVPAQIVVTPPAYVAPNVRARVRGLRLFRPRSAMVVPPQILVQPPAYVPAAVRPRLKGLRWLRPRAAVPQVGQTSLPAAPRVRARPVPARHGRSFSPPIPQPVVVPPAYPPGFSRVKKRLARIFRGATRFAAWPAGVTPPPGTSSPSPELTTRSNSADLTTMTRARDKATQTAAQQLLTQTTDRDLEV